MSTTTYIEEESRSLDKHSKIEDFLAMVIGTLVTGFGILLMQTSNTLTGGTAGLALLAHYITDIEFSVLFFLLNIPFYYLACKKMGTDMFIKTVISVCLLSFMTSLHPRFIEVVSINIQPIYGTIFANVLIGIGMLILFRHRATLGGFNLLALFIQDKYKIPAGKVQMGLDISVLAASFAFIGWKLLIVSVIGVIVLNSIITLNHKQERYIGSSLKQ